MKHRKFLEFNGKSIYLLAVDGTYWVAIRPICEALGVNYDRQYKNLKDDEILGGVYAKQHTHDASGRLQEMICLPEKWVYGWLFSIRSDSPELKEYKLTCYNLLYDHFHGILTQRLTVLREKAQTDVEVERLTKELKQTDEYKRLVGFSQQSKESSKLLRSIDDKAVRQMDIFNQDQE